MNSRKYKISFLLAALAVVTVLIINTQTVDTASSKKPKSILFQEKFSGKDEVNVEPVSFLEGITNIRINSFNGISEPSIAINPLDEQNIVIASNDFTLSGNKARIFHSGDGGLNWTSVTVPLSGLSGYTEATDPAIAYDADGNIFYAMIHYQTFGNGDGLFVNKSVDKGKTWNTIATEVKKNNDALTFEDRPSIAVDVSQSQFRNNVYVAWTSLGSQMDKILFAKSLDAANSFSNPIEIATGVVHTAAVKVDNNGVIFIAYLRDNSSIEIVKSVDGGNSFSSPVNAVTFEHSGVAFNNAYLLKKENNSGIRVKSYPSIAINDDNAIYIVYSAKNGEDLSDVFIISSVNGGTEWSAPVRVNDDNSTNDQFFPSVAAHNSKIYVIWQDSRDDISNRQINTYLAVSENPSSFINKKVSTSSFEPFNISLNNYIGDYNGLIVKNDAVIPVWTDGRNNGFDLYAGIIPNTPSSINDNNIAPKDFVVNKNYPNPFNPSTIISFSIPSEGLVNVKLYDMLGKEITTIMSEFKSKGTHSVEFNTNRLNVPISSGSYIYTVSFNGKMISNKMLLTK